MSEDRQAFNPYLPLNEYIPDGEPHVFGDRVYIFGSHDREGGTTYCELDYTVYSAPVTDLTDWRCEGTVYRAEQDPHVCADRSQMYAPDVVRGNDGRYYLYYCLAGQAGKNGFDGPISVAVCDTPAGKYEYLGDVRYPDGSPMTRFIPFDPAVINDNGTIRLYYGWSLPMTPGNGWLGRKITEKLMVNMFHKLPEEIRREPQGIMGANTVELKDDMLTVRGEPVRILPGIDKSKGTEYEDSLCCRNCSDRCGNVSGPVSDGVVYLSAALRTDYLTGTGKYRSGGCGGSRDGGEKTTGQDCEGHRCGSGSFFCDYVGNYRLYYFYPASDGTASRITGVLYSPAERGEQQEAKNPGRKFPVDFIHLY